MKSKEQWIMTLADSWKRVGYYEGYVEAIALLSPLILRGICGAEFLSELSSNYRASLDKAIKEKDIIIQDIDKAQK